MWRPSFRAGRDALAIATHDILSGSFRVSDGDPNKLVEIHYISHRNQFNARAFNMKPRNMQELAVEASVEQLLSTLRGSGKGGLGLDSIGKVSQTLLVLVHKGSE